MLGFTSNLVSSGLRDIIRFLVQHKYISGIVTTAGGIEEDLIKCLGHTYLTPNGGFDVDGASLRKQGLNRIGNLIVPNANYCSFEDWVMPRLDQMLEEQVKNGVIWTPSTAIARLGKEINDESSILYWAAKVSLGPAINCLLAKIAQNNIPVFCPALTDGSLGDMIFSHTYRTEAQLVIDIVGDIRRLNSLSMNAKKAGMVILGGGVCKHQVGLMISWAPEFMTLGRLRIRCCFGMVQTTLFISIRGKSLTGPTLERGLTKPSAGVKFEREQRR